MFTIRKKFKFETAHRLPDSYTKKCQQIHGHSYIGEVYITSGLLDNTGVVVDFTLIKEKLQEIIEKFDHKFILWEKDDLVEFIESAERSMQKDLGLMLFPYPPTAELFAKYIYDQFTKQFSDTTYRISSVRIHETETGWAEYKGE